MRIPDGLGCGWRGAPAAMATATSAVRFRFSPAGLVGAVTPDRVAVAAMVGRLLAPGWPALLQFAAPEVLLELVPFRGCRVAITPRRHRATADDVGLDLANHILGSCHDVVTRAKRDGIHRDIVGRFPRVDAISGSSGDARNRPRLDWGGQVVAGSNPVSPTNKTARQRRFLEKSRDCLSALSGRRTPTRTPTKICQLLRPLGVFEIFPQKPCDEVFRLE